MTKTFTVPEALQSLGIAEWTLSSLPINEEEFLAHFSKVVDVDENNHAIFSKDPQTFGVTWNQIQDEIQRLQLEYASEQYQRDRTANYPKLADQLDMLWHAIDSGTLNKTSDFYLALKQVKDNYPKG